jgi:transcription elongation GreA/GreB family factor
MAISRETKRHLEKADFDSIEADWITHLADDPADLDYATGVVRALTGHQQDDRAGFLLEIWDEELKSQGLWPVRLELLRRAGTILTDAAELHTEIERTLREIFPEHSAFADLVEYAGLHRGVEDLDKLWTKTDRLLEMLKFDAGTIVAMEGRGVARVTAISVELRSFRLEFEEGAPLSVGFRAADKMLQRLDADHILRMKLEHLDELEQLAQEQPEELLRRVLVSHDRPMTASEIREALTGVVADTSWSSWWSSARRHPQVLHDARGRSTYSWAESSEDAETSLWQTFESSEPRAQIQQLRRNEDRSAELTERMADHLAAEIERRRRSDPSVALEIALALDKLGRNEVTGDLSPAALLAAAPDPASALLGVEDRATREAGYRLLPKSGDEWLQTADRILRREADPRSVGALAEIVARADPARRDGLLDEALNQPRKMPGAFLWLVDQARENVEVRNRSPLRLIKQLLAALEQDEFKAARPSLQAELDSGGTVARLLPHLDSQQAGKAIEALRRAPIEEYRRTPLINSLQLQFDELATEKESPLYALPASIESKRATMRELKEVEIPRNRTAIQEARELGDLRENFEYKAARQRHEYLAARLAALDHDLTRARPIDLSTLDTSQVRVGCRVHLHSEGDEERVLTILGPWESDPDQGVLSHESELAQALLGRKRGETVDLPDGAYTIEAIERAEPAD